MKQNCFATLALILAFFASKPVQSQTIRIADNNFNAPTGAFIYATIQEAVDAADPGDIIQVQPSPNTYGSVSINKPNLTLIGIGFNLDKALPLESVMGNITITNNIDGTSEGDGTVIKGLTTGEIYVGFNTGPSYTLEDIRIENCSFDAIFNSSSGYSPVNNFELVNSTNYGTVSISGFGFCSVYFGNVLTNSTIRGNLLFNAIFFDNATPGTNYIRNNIIYSLVRIDAEGTLSIIEHNNFIGAIGTTRAFDVLRDCIVANNIFYGKTPSDVVGGGSTDAFFQRNEFTNNLSYNTGDDALPPSGGGVGNSGSGNIIGVSPSFINVPLLDTWEDTYDFTPQEAQVINGGSDGTDIGVTGGINFWTDTNFVLDTSPLPTIQILNTTTVINPTDDLPIRVKAKSN